MRRTYLWCANIFPGAPDATCLDPTLRIVPIVPCILDQVLKLKNCWKLRTKFLRALCSRVDDIGNERLDITITAKAAFDVLELIQIGGTVETTYPHDVVWKHAAHKDCRYRLVVSNGSSQGTVGAQG